MNLFRDLFSSRRRHTSRVAVRWMVDLAVPDSDPQHWTGLFATDLSAQGIRLQGLDPDAIRRLLTDEGHAHMKLRLPGMRLPLPLVAAELRWGMGEKPHFRTGWLFAQIDKETRELLDRYIAEHPEDQLADPT
jgi:hypothetical protein